MGKQLLVADQVKLQESAVSDDGLIEACLITPGWGSSGYYAESLLKENADKFIAGLHMYWDHPTVTEEWQRPERTLRDLAGALVEEAEWKDEGWSGPGIYAKAKVFKDYKETVDEIAPHIGISIRAYGTTHVGEAEGDSGDIVDSIVAVASADFVTLPGRGGKIKSMFESLRSNDDKDEPQRKDAPVDDVLKKQYESRIQELEAQLTEAKGNLATAQTELEEARGETALLREAVVLSEAKTAVEAELGKDKYDGLPEMSKTRLAEAVSAKPPVKDGSLDKEELVRVVEAKVKAEVDYLSKLGFGKVVGLGESRNPDEDAENDANESGNGTPDKLEESFKRLGLSESRAKIAAGGRN